MTEEEASRTLLNITVEDAVNANIPFVEGVVYKVEDCDYSYVRAAHTFNGWVCDCWVCDRNGNVREGRETPIPVRREHLGEVVWNEH